MSTKCTLKIRTSSFNLALEGDAAMVRAGYEGIRTELLHQLGGHTGDNLPLTPVRPPADGSKAGSARRTEGRQEYVWVFRSNDLFHKVHVIERRRLFGAGIGRYVHPGRLERIFVESEHAELIEPLVPLGKTLWSELTKLGRERLRSE